MAPYASMTEALRLTRTGRLAEASALIRDTLGGKVVRSDDSPAADRPVSPIIDLIPDHVAIRSKPLRDDGSSERATSETRRHTGTAGSIEYLIYRPASFVSGMPLVVMLHGCTQSPEDFARGTAMNRLADELGFLVAYPRQTRAANQQKCWNWFRPGDQQRDRGEPALIAGLTRDIISTEKVDSTRVYIAGLSAGGAAAAVMADAYPDLFAAVGIHSGLACGIARDVPSALAAMKRGGARGGKSSAKASRFVPVITFHGKRDATVHEVNSREIVERATAAIGAPVTTDIETGTTGGRSYTRALHRDETGRVLIERWTIAGAGHAWSGGDASGTYVDAAGPDASREMIRFFLTHGGGGATA